MTNELAEIFLKIINEINFLKYDVAQHIGEHNLTCRFDSFKEEIKLLQKLTL